MEKNKHRLIVVLGMHRSGTSAIARGLQVLGVQLGDKLLPPMEGVNEKGFWEDMDLNALNVEMLHALKSDWHFVTPIETSDVETLKKNGYLSRAITMLHEKTAGVELFGLKDPRTVKLLPFWKEVFAQSGIEVSYIIVSRNPLSVCQSLKKRDGFEYEKSCFLWLEHVLNSLIYTENENCVLTDFDNLMQSPTIELSRIAKALQLSIDPEELELFKTEFLNNELRHSIYQLDDLGSDETIPPLIREVYEEVLKIAADKVALDDPEFRRKLRDWKNEPLNQKSALTLVDKLSSNLLHTRNEKVQALQEKQQLLQEKQQLLQEKQQILQEHQQIIQQKQETIRNQEKSIETLSIKLAGVEKQIQTIRSSILGWPVRLFIKINRLQTRLQNASLIQRSGLFDRDWYLAVNSDVAQLGVDPVRHYLVDGGFEGRDPSPYFNSSSYFNDYRDVKLSGENPLIHYLRYGRAEGRVAKPSLAPRSITNQESAHTKLGQSTYDLKTLLQFITRNRIKRAWGYFIRGDIKSIRRALSYLSRKAVPVIVENELDLVACAQNFQPKTELGPLFLNSNQEIDLVVPIFNGMIFLPTLFDGLFKNTNIPFRLIIVDDNSSDPAVRPFLKRLAEKHSNVRLLFNEENQGFVKTINIASTYVQNHFAILNSDIEVPEGWLQRLMKPILDNPQIASVTPFTNSGTICSFPNTLVDNPIFAGLDVDGVDSVFKQIDTESSLIEVPTGVGFCMAINWRVWKEIGSFDEDRFGRGYGEENDWCMRAVSAGYSNFLVPNLFIYHKHGGSFLSEEKQKLMKENWNKLISLHPNYPSRVQEFIAADPPRALRKFASFLLMASASQKDPILIFDHQIGGGANLYREQMVRERLKQDRATLIITYEANWQALKLQVLFKEYTEVFKVRNPKDLLILEKFISLSEIYYNNLVTYPEPLSVIEVLIQLKDIFQAKLKVLVHDYYLLCPSYTLMDYTGKFCNLPDESVCNVCLPKNEYRLPYDKNEATNISTWRKSWSNLIKKADEVICFSKSSQDLLLRVYDLRSEQFSIQPHKFVPLFNRKPEIDLQRPLNIGVFGAINYHKGSQMVLDVARILAVRYPDFKITVVGVMEYFINLPNLTVLGPYQQSELPDLIEGHKINLCFFPSIIPETFSFVTSELINLEMPICSFNIGAPAERIKEYELGRLINKIDAETAVNELVSFYNELRSAKEIPVHTKR